MKPYLLSVWLFLATIPSFAQDQKLECGVVDEIPSAETLEIMASLPRIMRAQSARKAANENLYVSRLWIEIDSDTYAKFSGDTVQIYQDVYRMIDQVSQVYEEEIQTRLVVSKINIHKDPSKDPYAKEADVFKLLSTFYNRGEKYPKQEFDMAMYLPTKPFTGAGGVASGKYNVSPYGVLKTIAHELGHNFSSPHTQSCFWPGGPLDHCYAAEGDCYTGALENRVGTLMSYCNQNFFTFHPTVRALMYNFAVNNLQKSTAPKGHSQYLINQAVSHRYLLLKPDLNATSYTYEIAKDSSFTSIVQQGISRFNVVYFDELENQISYFLRVKTENRGTFTEWSVPERFSAGSALLPPRLKDEESFTAQEWPRNASLALNLIGEGDRFEVEFYNPQNAYTLFAPWYQFTSTSPDFTILAYQIAYQSMLFRVRSHKGDARSAWSKYYPIEFVQDVNAKIRENKAVSSSESYRDYSFSYTKDFTEMFSSYRLKLSEQSDLSSPVYVQESEANKHEFNYYRPFRLPLLKPNQNYRLDLEVFSPKEDYSMNRKEGVWRTISKSFRTGVSDFQEYVTLHSAASDTSLGEFIKIPVLVKGNYTYTLTEKGLHQWKGKELHTYHLGNTNSKISNRSYFTEDALGQFITVTPTSSRSGGYEGAFPLQVYDYTVWNEENMSPKSSLTFSLPTASHYIMGVQAGIIITNLGLFRIQDNKLQKLNISDLEFYTVNTIQASDGILWVTPHLQLHGCVVRGYSEDGQVLHALNSCSPIASDKTGNVYYIHDREKRLYRYNLDSRTHELQNVYIGSDLKGVLSDPYGGIHLYVHNQGFRHLLSFDDGQWRHNSNYFYTDPNKEVPQIDRKGNWWGNSSSFVTQVDPCYGTNAPIVSKKEEDGNVFLLAQGCRSTLWSWETPLEKKEDVLQGNRLQIVNAEVGGTYTARCYNRGCLSPDAKIVLTGKYTVSLTFPSSLCGGQQLSVEVKTDHPFPAGAKLEFELSSGAKKYVWGEFASATRLNLGTLDVQAGVYDVALREVNGTNFSARYGTLEILPSPAVYLGGKANLCAQGSPQAYGLEITGGTAPFTYTWTVNGVLSTQTTAQYLLSEGATLQGAVKDKNGCLGVSIPLVVKTIPAPNVTLSATISPDGKKVISVPETKGQTYQWFLNNQSIPGANAPVHTAAVPGNYSVHVQNEGCTAISETFVVEVVLGAEESIELSVFPNPVQRSFAIEVEGHKGDKVEIMDPAGRVIWSQKIKKNGEVRLKVNAEGWASGTYHVVLPGKYRKLVKL